LEAVLILAVLFAVAVYSAASEDITLFDETAYLTRGIAARSGEWPEFTNGATYSDLYYALSWLTPDHVGLYFAGRALAAVLFVAGVWLAARLVAGRTLGWVAAAVIAVTSAPYTWPGVSAPAAGAVLVAVALVFRWPGLPAFGVATGLFWLSAGSRPELAWFALVCSLIAIVWAVVLSNRRTGSRVLLFAWISVTFGALVIPAILMLLHGLPVSSDGREWLAFQQHFALRQAAASEDPWLQAGTITARAFPGASSLGEAAMANPGALLGHIVANIQSAPRVLSRTVLLGSGLLPLAALGALVAGALLAVVADPRRSCARAREVGPVLVGRRYRLPLVVLALLTVALMIPPLVVYPREHYLLVPAGAFVVALAAVQRHLGTQRFTALIPLALVVVIYATFGVQGVRQVVKRVAYPAPFAATAVRMIDAGTPWRLLAYEPGIDVYVPNVTLVADEPLQPGETFLEYLVRNEIDAVFANGSDAFAPWGSAEGLSDFMGDPSRYGFERPFTGSRLWLKTG
jgi:hypothetical protein